MATPDVFGLNKLKKTMEHNIMEETVRPRRNNAWTMHNRHQIKISNHFDSHQSRLRKTIPGEHDESVPQSYNTRTKQKGITSGCNTIKVVKTFTDYCDRCSLHGLKYVGDLQLHPLERIFWTVAFILAVVTAAYFITLLYHKWDDSPVIESIAARATKMISIPFPAVTVCNMNKARKSVAEEILNSKNPEDALNKILLKDLCDESYEIYSSSTVKDKDVENRIGNWDTIQNFMTYVRQPCHDMIQSCYYAGQLEKCEDIFNPSLTDEGICCSFNKVKRDFIFRNPRDLSDLNVTFPTSATDWTPEAGYPPESTTRTLPWRPRGTGSHLGLTLVLDAKIDDYYCSSTASTGFKVRLHNPVETPKVADFGFLVSAGEEYRVTIRPIISNASPSLRKIPENKRQCLFSNEKYLKFYRTYTQRNCALECEANYTLATCSCVPYYLPKDANTTICAKRDENCTTEARKTSEIRLTDESANTSNFGTDSQELSPKRCQCLPGCNELRYRGTLSSSAMSGKFTLSKEYNATNQTYFRQNTAVVHLFFTESQFMAYYKSELFGFTEFLSNTGGLLGLFLGFSFLSAVEAVYFISMRVWCSVLQRHQHAAADRQTSVLLTNSSHVSVVTPYPFAQ